MTQHSPSTHTSSSTPSFQVRLVSRSDGEAMQPPPVRTWAQEWQQADCPAAPLLSAFSVQLLGTQVLQMLVAGMQATYTEVAVKWKLVVRHLPECPIPLLA
jgi:hypothetical protein